MKDLIRKSFSKNTSTYDDYAAAQKKGAEILKNELINDGICEKNIEKIIEFGCGTGLLSIYIHDLFYNSKIYFSDISPEMVLECRKKLGPNVKRYFFAVNGEDFKKENYFDLIVSSFTLQWFEDYQNALKNYFFSLKRGGFLYLAFQGPGSFFEWKKVACELGLPFTGNLMPDPELIENSIRNFSSYEIFKKEIKLKYKSSLDFFKSLQKIGAGHKTGKKSYSKKELMNIIRYWDNKTGNNIVITYEVYFVKGIK
ncbi:MAG: methyltransferase [Desulfobacteraceae bacterium]|nr:methyltransferase [Desulfobacteraceae bacterium]